MPVDLIQLYDKKFREQEIHQILQTLYEGDSVSLLGTGSAGKTHLLRYLTTREDMLNYHLETLPDNLQAKDWLWVPIDPNSLLELPVHTGTTFPPSWAGYELLLRAIRESLSINPAVSDETRQAITRTYQALFDTSLMGPVRSFLYLQTALDALLGAFFQKGRIIFTFDESERLFDCLPDHFFITLRALRDRHRYRIAFLAALRQPFEQLLSAERQARLEPFLELFRQQVYISYARTDHDFNLIYNLLQERMGGDMPEAFRQRLYTITGGHAGLMRSCYRHRDALQKARDNHPDLPNADILAALRQPSIVKECFVIWQSLTPDERQLAWQLAQTDENMPPYTRSLSKEGLIQQQLVNKGVLKYHKKHYTLHPPLLTTYIAGLSSGDIYNIYPAYPLRSQETLSSTDPDEPVDE